MVSSIVYIHIRVCEIDIFIQIRKMFTNVHNVLTHIGIRKLSKHWRLSGSGTKLFITYLSLRFFDMRRERHNFFHKRAAHFVDTNWSRFGETKNRLPSSRLESQLTAFYQTPKSSALTGMTLFTSPVQFPIWGFYCDISDCHIHPARAWTLALNVCT